MIPDSEAVTGAVEGALSEGVAGASGSAASRVFRTGGNAAKAAATKYAVDSGGETLGMTPLGEATLQATDRMPWSQARPIWDAASQVFAEGASGVAHVFIDLEAAQEGSIWAETELPSLVANESVTDVLFPPTWRGLMTEQFTEPEPNVIQSSAGFRVKVLGHTGIKYEEGNRSIFIDSEVMAKSDSIVVVKKTIRFWEGQDPDRVLPEDQERIASNIKRAFESCGYGIVIAEPLDWSSVALRRPSEKRRP